MSLGYLLDVDSDRCSPSLQYTYARLQLSKHSIQLQGRDHTLGQHYLFVCSLDVVYFQGAIYCIYMTQSPQPNKANKALWKEIAVQQARGIEQVHGDVCTHTLFALCDLTEITLLTLYQRNKYDMWECIIKNRQEERGILQSSLTRETLL